MTTRTATRKGSQVSYNVEGFGGGLNKAVSSFKLRDDELRDCKNVRFGLAGSIQTRGGIRKYETSGLGGAPNDKEPKSLWRYNRSDGVRKILLQAEGKFYADDGLGAFSSIGDTLFGDDGYTRFTQWRDTVFLANGQTVPKTYNSGATSTYLDAMSRLFYTPNNVFNIVAVTNTNATFEADKVYSYKFTADLYHGDEFLGESFPINNDPDCFRGLLFEDKDYIGGPITPGAGNEVQIKVDDWLTSEWYSFSDNIKTFNVYRSLAHDSGWDVNDWGYVGVPHFLVGSFSLSDWKAGSAGDVLLRDYGYLPKTSRPLKDQLLIRQFPPAARFMVPYKNRMWYLSAKDDESESHTKTSSGRYWKNLELKQAHRNSRVWHSQFLQPSCVRYDAFFDISEEDGEGLTGGMNWKNRALFAFKPNSIHGIFGGDSENLAGILDIELEAVDEAVGCVAPNSLAQGEGGAMFLSNRGVMFFDGTRPYPMKSEQIDPILKTIPDYRRQLACGIYLNKERKYYLAISSNDVDPSTNSVVLEFDFYTKTWTKHIYLETNTTQFGFNSFLELKRGDEAGKLLAAIDKTGAAQTATGAIQVLDDCWYENQVAKEIPWEAKTKYFDCGEPHLLKEFDAIVVRCKTAQTIIVGYDVDEGGVTGTSPTNIENIAVTSAHTWDEASLVWKGAGAADNHFWGAIQQGETLLRFPQGVRGRRISFTFSGSTHLPDTEIQGLTIKYTRLDMDEL